MKNLGLMRFAVICILAVTLVFACEALALAADSTAEIEEITNPNSVMDGMKEIVDAQMETLLSFARSLFFSLATISLAFGLGQMILSGESSLGGVAAHLTKWITYTSFFGLVMSQNSWFFIPNVIKDSFIGAGLKMLSLSTSDGSALTMPGDLLGYGVKVYGSMIDIASKYGVGRSIIAGLAGIMIVIIFALMAATVAVTFIEMYLVICGGSILLGFAGSEFTKDIAISYLKYAVSVGAKILICMLIAKVAMDMSEKWVEQIAKVGGWEFKQFFIVVGYILGGSVTLYLAANMVPGLVQGMISGASVSTGSQLTSMGKGAMGAAVGAAATGANISAAAKKFKADNPNASKGAMLRAGGAYLRDQMLHGKGSAERRHGIGEKQQGGGSGGGQAGGSGTGTGHANYVAPPA